ncbi:hypothetical protein ETD86_02100 [Nonomuraea turkmeniaca]|uniref:Uncharacterized protein n=1 Tax=Nonomuraea turkmeniaca TaxID=103838 RepID=A0A5S4FWV0_9ACTN|nr:hypothetical protein [Nonomuraea turkmeniaca]TMR25159.1 hypothetical protein ETD86_02100 [Nonomuraea turkmeniaca]
MEPTRMLTGRGVLRVVWLPGSDLLQGTCHCGATHLAEGPIEVWEWLLAHPIGHTPEAATALGEATPAPAVVAPGQGTAAHGPAALSGAGVPR